MGWGCSARAVPAGARLRRLRWGRCISMGAGWNARRVGAALPRLDGVPVAERRVTSPIRPSEAVGDSCLVTSSTSTSGSWAELRAEPDEEAADIGARCKSTPKSPLEASTGAESEAQAGPEWPSASEHEAAVAMAGAASSGRRRRSHSAFKACIVSLNSPCTLLCCPVCTRAVGVPCGSVRLHMGELNVHQSTYVDSV